MTPVEIGSGRAAASRSAPSGESILCVDDDPNILEALQRQFRKTFRIETALGPERGLALMQAKGPFAVVISDLRMPGMNGIQFLTNVRMLAPETVRVMFTGQADLADAIAAVNQGAIFRFLLKPSSAIILSKVIESALEQHRLIVAERQLTQQLGLPAGARPAAVPAASAEAASADPVSFGAAILQAAIEFDERRRRGLSHSDALASMRAGADRYPPAIMAALTRLEKVELAEQMQVVPLSRLAAGMILEQDICGRNGMCLIGKGQQITATLLQRLQGFSHTLDKDAPVAVRIPELQTAG